MNMDTGLGKTLVAVMSTLEVMNISQKLRFFVAFSMVKTFVLNQGIDYFLRQQDKKILVCVNDSVAKYLGDLALISQVPMKKHSCKLT